MYLCTFAFFQMWSNNFPGPSDKWKIKDQLSIGKMELKVKKLLKYEN